MNPYQTTIQRHVPDADPRHVQAFMLLNCGTLDHLSPGEFEREAHEAAQAVRVWDPERVERLAESYGL